MNTGKKKQLTMGIVLTAFLLAADQFTKYLAAQMLKGKPSFVLIPGVFELHYLENQSAAFSMDPVSLFQRIFKLAYFTENPEAFLKAKMIFFVVLTVVVLIGIAFLYLRVPELRRFLALRFTLILLFAGAIGNLIDRFINNYVIDFFYFSLIDFPVFNVADIYITCAAFLLVLEILLYYKEEDLEMIFPSKAKGTKDKK